MSQSRRPELSNCVVDVVNGTSKVKEHPLTVVGLWVC